MTQVTKITEPNLNLALNLAQRTFGLDVVLAISDPGNRLKTGLKKQANCIYLGDCQSMVP